MKNQLRKTMTAAATLTLGIALLGTHANAITTSKTSYQVSSLDKFRTVSNSKTVYIYRSPSATSKKLVKIPKNSAVIIVGPQSKGFSKIQFEFGFAYVKTSDLQKAKARNGTTYARNIQHNYRYELPLNKGTSFKNTFTAKYMKTYAESKALKNFWLYKSEPDNKGIVEYDTAKGLYVGDTDDGYLSLAVKYGAKKGATWKGQYGDTSKVISTTATVKTAAGTYKNVTIVKSNGESSYYAPNKGLIVVKNNKGLTVMKLIK